MESCKTILFPVDFSEAVEAVVPYVRNMAEHFKANVTVLHAFNVLPDYPLVPVPGYSNFRSVPVPYTQAFEDLRNARQQQLDEFCRKHFQNVLHTPEIEDGDPSAAIETVVQRDNVDLIMMPTSGLGRFRRMIMGSLTTKVLHDVRCAVWTSAHARESDLPAAYDYDYRSILCAVDIVDETDAVLKAGDLLARIYGAHLSAMNIDSRAEKRDTNTSKDALGEALQRALNAEVSATVRLAEPTVPDGIRDAALAEKADLVVVGRGHSQRHLIGSWSRLYTIIRESPCPVLSV